MKQCTELQSALDFFATRQLIGAHSSQSPSCPATDGLFSSIAPHRFEFPDRNIIESVYVWVTIFAVRVEATRYCQETTTYKNEDYLFPQRHGYVAEVTFVVDNSMDPWSQSSAYGESFSVIVELVDMAG